MELLFVVFGVLAPVLPIALTILAIARIVQHGAEWWWIAGALGVPLGLLLVWGLLASRSPRSPRIENVAMLGRPAAPEGASGVAGAGGDGWAVAARCGRFAGRLSTLDC